MDGVGLRRAFELMEQYADHPMDLADASLSVAAEVLPTRKIFTIDRQDFATIAFGEAIVIMVWTSSRRPIPTAIVRFASGPMPRQTLASEQGFPQWVALARAA